MVDIPTKGEFITEELIADDGAVVNKLGLRLDENMLLFTEFEEAFEAVVNGLSEPNAVETIAEDLITDDGTVVNKLELRLDENMLLLKGFEEVFEAVVDGLSEPNAVEEAPVL